MEKEIIGKYEVTEHGKGFWTIDEGGVRSFLIEGSEKALLADTGFGTGDMKSAVLKLTDKPITLVNTHIDRDHTGCNDSFQKIYMHPKEIADYASEKKDTELLPITEGYVFDLGGKELEVIEAPGHTPGSVMLLDRYEKMLISGDSIGLAPIFMFGVRRNLSIYIKSIKKIKEMAESFDTVWPSHGPCPVEPNLLDELIEGAKKLEKGELEPKEPGRELPCKLYEFGRAKFLY